ncbi:hypothetical protein Vadar_023144 [Vaccinium darrowii]|uniref:Uncharacterized protein n=1 Tax=Vaccinium darrowii TaxID=229202 RepID=A0ACB7ZDI3_9ERIC|nr:hypothetical protein Vadar_023144 [Vaccinium darrowii]
MLELDAMAQKLGYAPPVAFYYKRRSSNLNNGLIPITCDKEAYGMLDFMDTERNIVVSWFFESNVEVLDDVDPQVVDDNVKIEEEVEDDSDSSTESVYYNDHSYLEDDGLYEAYVENETKFVGFPEDRRANVEHFDDQRELSDGDDKCDSENSFYSSSNLETEGRRKGPFKNFRSETDMEDPKFNIGMYVSTPKDFKQAIKQHAIKHQRNIKLVKNDKRRVRTRCQKPCQWEVYAAKVLGEASYQGLLPALAEEVLRAEHRHCAKHLLSNFQKRFKGVSLEEKFWKCSKASHVPLFEDAMKEMKEEEEEAYNWLILEAPRYWSKLMFKREDLAFRLRNT